MFSTHTIKTQVVPARANSPWRFSSCLQHSLQTPGKALQSSFKVRTARPATERPVVDHSVGSERLPTQALDHARHTRRSSVHILSLHGLSKASRRATVSVSRRVHTKLACLSDLKTSDCVTVRMYHLQEPHRLRNCHSLLVQLARPSQRIDGLPSVVPDLGVLENVNCTTTTPAFMAGHCE